MVYVNLELGKVVHLELVQSFSACRAAPSTESRGQHMERLHMIDRKFFECLFMIRRCRRETLICSRQVLRCVVGIFWF